MGFLKKRKGKAKLELAVGCNTTERSVLQWVEERVREGFSRQELRDYLLALSDKPPMGTSYSVKRAVSQAAARLAEEKETWPSGGFKPPEGQNGLCDAMLNTWVRDNRQKGYLRISRNAKGGPVLRDRKGK